MSLIKKIDEDKMSFYDGDEKVLWIEEFPKENSVVEVVVGGELRSETVHDFDDEMKALVSVGMNLTLDFKDVSYISNTYVDSLVSIQTAIEKHDNRMTIRNLKPEIQQIFLKTGAYDLLMIE